MAQAHVRAARAVLYTLEGSAGDEQAQIVKVDLAKIGIRVEIRTFSINDYFALLSTRGEPFDLAYGGWEADYADPEDFLSALLENSGNEPTFVDPATRRRLDAAARLAGPERYLVGGALDLDLARRDAPLAAYGVRSVHDLFSSRIGCQSFGSYGMDLAALCVRPHTR
jgi:hypothetical protein